MSATIGKDLETGMTTITFDSTGRMVQFTKGESDDFDLRMLIVKAESKLSKESIGSKAVYALQQLGEAIEGGDPETIAALWLANSKIVDAGVLNNIIEEIQYDNPFSLFYINDKTADKEDVQRALVVSTKVKDTIDTLAKAISDLEMTSEYVNLLPFAAQDIRTFYDSYVGLADTVSREKMADYFEGLLEKIFDAVDYTQMRQDFVIHL